MVIKNTPENRKLVKRLSKHIRSTASYFEGKADLRWNMGQDIRFEICSIGYDNPVIVRTAYTVSGFHFNIRLLKNQLDSFESLDKARWVLDDAEELISGINCIIKAAAPTVSEHF